ncbi:MAG: hypothetical protein IJK14_01090 [Clostridia bacterium]|nr:hypothetical protein [Clostridia bacterium]
MTSINKAAAVLTALLLGVSVIGCVQPEPERQCSEPLDAVISEGTEETTLGSDAAEETVVGIITGVEEGVLTLTEMKGQEQMNASAPPEKPEGEDPSPDSGTPGEPPEMQRGESVTILTDQNTEVTVDGVPGSLESLSSGMMATVVLRDGVASSVSAMSGPPDTPGPGQNSPGEMPMPGHMADAQDRKTEITYSAVEYCEQDTDFRDAAITSEGTDESAVIAADGTTVRLENVAVVRNSADSTGGDASSFYGVGAAVLANGGTVKVDGGSITTDADGGAGLFAVNGGTVYAQNTEISTEKGTSGGVHVAGSGTLYGWNLTVDTNGRSSAAVRSDRGGGTIRLDGGTYTSNGSGSPAIYSTADISVKDAVLSATGSEAICIEGKNSVSLYDCQLSGNMKDDSQNDCTWTVILYQSMSGDAEEGTSVFNMRGGSIESGNGGIFYTTNTSSVFTLQDVAIHASEDSEFLLRCTGNANARGWGKTGSNGAKCVFTGIHQELNGDIVWDSVSKLQVYLTEGSCLKGAVVQDKTYEGEGTSELIIDVGSRWIVTADSSVSALYCAGTVQDMNGKTVTIRNTDGEILVQGSSGITVTVGVYSTDCSLENAGTIRDYEI